MVWVSLKTSQFEVEDCPCIHEEGTAGEGEGEREEKSHRSYQHIEHIRAYD